MYDIIHDILGELDRGDFTVLTQLVLSVAFDTVDHETLLSRLEMSYEIRSAFQNWFASYPHSRQQFVRRIGLDWIGLSSVLRPRQHCLGYMGDGFTGQKTQPTVSKY